MSWAARLVERGNAHLERCSRHIEFSAVRRVAFVLGLSVLFYGPLSQHSLAQEQGSTIETIGIQGSQRIEPDTIRTYLTVREGDLFDPIRIDRSLKNLFATGLFADVTIAQQGTMLLVRVVENPIINRISIEGNDQVDDEDMVPEIQLRPRVVYTRTRVQQDVDKILELYRREGRFAARVEPKVIELPQNRVDVVFEIVEGPPTYVRTINFVGNEAFDDSELRDIILTREERWWRLFTSNDTYDPDRMAFDRELLRQNYVEQGYADFEVVSAIAELAPNRENFYMTFTVSEGPRYRFDDIKLEVNVEDLPRETLEAAIVPQGGDWFNGKQLEDTIEAVSDAAGIAGYAFVEVRPQLSRNVPDRLINVTFEIVQGPRVFVERVDIRGNNRTLENVVRRELLLVEGDAFNAARVRRSKQRLENLGFFKEETVEIESTPSDIYPDRTVLNVAVEEQNTGELTFGVGFSSTTGALVDVGYRERNLLGRGQDLRLSFSLAQQQSQINVGFTEPYFMNRRLASGLDLFASRSDFQSESGFTQENYGGSARIGFSYNEYLFQRLNYQLIWTSLTGLDNATSQFVIEQAGTAITSQVSTTVVYDRRNSVIEPTSGFYVTLTGELAGLGGNERFVRGSAAGAFYLEPFDGWIFSSTTQATYIVGLGEDVKIVQRSQMGGFTLRGFDDFGASPRDAATGNAVGGDWMVTTSFELRIPLGLSAESGIKTYLFNDWGVIGPPTDLLKRGDVVILHSQAFRGAAGIGVEWTSVLPITVDFSPLIINAQGFDRTRKFRLNFGTRF
jgi:outer membrane protein insertion porin family